MLWYLIILALMLYPYAISRAGTRTGRPTKHISLFAACLILWFFMAFRDVSVGVDTKYYCFVFSQFEQIPFSEVFTAVTYGTTDKTWAFEFEPGYRILNKLVSLISLSPQAITIANATIILVLWYLLIRRDSPNYLLSIWLFITLGVYQTEMNVTRNAISILLVYYAFPYLKKGAFFRYAAVCLLAALFHVAALLYIPVYFLVRGFRISVKRMMVLIGVFCMMGIVFPFVRPYLVGLFPARFDQYLQGSNEKLSMLLVGLLNAGIFVLTMWLLPRRKREKVYDVERLGVMLLTINLCFFGLNIGLRAAGRMAALFGPYLVILIPRMLRQIERPAARKQAVILITALSGVQYVLRMLVNNIGGTLPFEFCW